MSRLSLPKTHPRSRACKPASMKIPQEVPIACFTTKALAETELHSPRIDIPRKESQIIREAHSFKTQISLLKSTQASSVQINKIHYLHPTKYQRCTLKLLITTALKRPLSNCLKLSFIFWTTQSTQLTPLKVLREYSLKSPRTESTTKEELSNWLKSFNSLTHSRGLSHRHKAWIGGWWTSTSTRVWCRQAKTLVSHPWLKGDLGDWRHSKPRWIRPPQMKT